MNNDITNKANAVTLDELLKRLEVVEAELKKPKLETTQKATLEFDMNDCVHCSLK